MSHSSESSLPHRKSLDRLWIVVADGGHARVLAVSADRVRMEVMREMTSANLHLKTHDLVSDRSGRSFESASPTRHAIAPRHDPHVEQKHHFIRALADVLTEGNRAGLFDQLILIVTHGQMKALQDGLDPLTLAKVYETIGKDLTGESPSQVCCRVTQETIYGGFQAIGIVLRRGNQSCLENGNHLN